MTTDGHTSLISASMAPTGTWRPGGRSFGDDEGSSYYADGSNGALGPPGQRNPPNIRWKVDLWVLPPSERGRPAWTAQWQLFDTAYYGRFEDILTIGPVGDWRHLAAMWIRTVMCIEEEELNFDLWFFTGLVRYEPVCMW